MSERLRLYFVLDIDILGGRSPLAVAKAALHGGVTAIQLRAKSWTRARQAALAAPLLDLAREYGVPLIVNDHVELGLALGAAGAHLGVDDLPAQLARRIWPDGLLGYSPDAIADARSAIDAGVDYLGIGPFASTSTKRDAGPAIGAAGVRAMAALGPPIVAIGGITEANAGAALAAGAVGVAVAGAIIAAPDPAEAARRLRERVFEPWVAGAAAER